ncbi:Hypothetical predicted protein [Octopus vulgaris]|uniref:Uncharacterized protein n=1 Tax=Octopus vulgaris TaxID=6645 RepID=A0AA36C127_OCTVU|nr:Hypothetical predicted protein [Octopus vulgaris]
MVCASLCASDDNCGYFNYCKGKCILYRRWYTTLTESDCYCTSYFLVFENSTTWQSVFFMTADGFVKSPLYLHWSSLPISEKTIRELQKSNITSS